MLKVLFSLLLLLHLAVANHLTPQIPKAYSWTFMESVTAWGSSAEEVSFGSHTLGHQAAGDRIIKAHVLNGTSSLSFLFCDNKNVKFEYFPFNNTCGAGEEASELDCFNVLGASVLGRSVVTAEYPCLGNPSHTCQNRFLFGPIARGLFINATLYLEFLEDNVHYIPTRVILVGQFGRETMYFTMTTASYVADPSPNPFDRKGWGWPAACGREPFTR